MEEKKNQIWAFIVTGMMLLVSAIYYSVNPYYIYVVAYIWFGFAYGMMLQYGRFCFASASRDLFAAGVPRMAVGVLVALMFFSVIQATLASTNMSTFHPAPFGIHTLIAGLIFGVGMVLSGGCASGSLYKIGEGNMTSFLAAFFGLCIGQAVFVDVKWFNFMIPQKWVDAAVINAAARDIPVDKMTSSFDTYLAGYIYRSAYSPVVAYRGLFQCPAGNIKVFHRRHSDKHSYPRCGCDLRNLLLLQQKRLYEEEGETKGWTNRFWRRACRHLEYDNRIQENYSYGRYHRYGGRTSYLCHERHAEQIRDIKFRGTSRKDGASKRCVHKGHGL